MTTGYLTYPLSRLNNIIQEGEGQLIPFLELYYDLDASKIPAWGSYPEPLTEDYQSTGDILKAHIELSPSAPTQFISLEFREDDGLKVFVASDILGRLGSFPNGAEIDLLNVAGFKINTDAFQGAFVDQVVFAFSIYRYSPDIVSLFSSKAAAVFLDKVFTQDMPEAPGTASDYNEEVNQVLTQIRFGRAHLRGAARRLDTTPVSMPYEIDATGTDITDRSEY